MAQHNPDLQPPGDGTFRNPQLYGTAAENSFSGALSFMRRPYTRDLMGVDLAVTGIPFDLATSNRPGARFGPAAIRAATAQIAWGTPFFPWGFDPFLQLAVVDYGDCYFEYWQPENVPGQIQAHVAPILEAGVTLLSLGGDHFATLPLLRAHHAVHGPLALVHFDAHADVEEGAPGIDHGSMFRAAVREGLVDPSHSAQIGVRTFHETDLGFHVLDAPFVHANSGETVAQRVHDIVGDRQAYLTFDIDCLDPAFAPGSGTPVPGGLSTAVALEIVRQLRELRIVGMDIMEVSPPYDHAELTALAAAELAKDLVCLHAVRMQND